MACRQRIRASTAFFEEGLIGGGKLDRLLNRSYHRVYLNNLAMLPDQNYKVDIKDSKLVFSKTTLSFFSL